MYIVVLYIRRDMMASKNLQINASFSQYTTSTGAEIHPLMGFECRYVFAYFAACVASNRPIEFHVFEHNMHEYLTYI